MQDQPATPPSVKGRIRRSELGRRETRAAESEVGDLTEEKERVGNWKLAHGWGSNSQLVGQDQTKTANRHFFPLVTSLSQLIKQNQRMK